MKECSKNKNFLSNCSETDGLINEERKVKREEAEKKSPSCYSLLFNFLKVNAYSGSVKTDNIFIAMFTQLYHHYSCCLSK